MYLRGALEGCICGHSNFWWAPENDISLTISLERKKILKSVEDWGKVLECFKFHRLSLLWCRFDGKIEMRREPAY